MISLLLASAFFVGIHLFIAGTGLRDRVVARIGERGFTGLFSLLSLVGLVWMCRAYSNAPYHETWGAVSGPPGSRMTPLVGSSSPGAPSTRWKVTRATRVPATVRVLGLYPDDSIQMTAWGRGDRARRAIGGLPVRHVRSSPSGPESRNKTLEVGSSTLPTESEG